MQCRMCGSNNLVEIFRAEKCPKYSHKYLQEGELGSDALVSLGVSECPKCSLIQLSDDFPEEEYSADYQRNISFSKSALAHAEKYAGKLSALGAEKFVEIGCGNGFFSEQMQKRGAEVVAFEPSRAACKTARERGINAINSFFDGNAPAQYAGFDSFALRFVLEHVPKPVQMLEMIGSRCIDGAVGLVELPNAQKQIDHKKWFEFFREHTLYFTPQTAKDALARAGFEVLEMNEEFDGEFISIIVRKKGKRVENAGGNGQAPNPAQKYDWGKEEFCRQLHSMLQQGKKTWVWGASGAGITLLAECGITAGEIGAIVDSDRNKWGLYASGSKIRIVEPEEVKKGKPDAVLIITTAYEKEIAGQLRQLGYAGKIGSIFPKPRWL